MSWLAQLVGVNPLTPGARSWYRDAVGEIRNAKALKNLGPGFTLLHCAPTGNDNTDVDHLVIGVTGVFTVTTRNHSGYRILVADDVLTVNTRRTNHIRDARFEAARATKLLDPKASEKVMVVPLIAIVDPRSLAFGPARPSDVVVVASSQLARTITRRKRVLDSETIDTLVARAEFNGAWHSDARVNDETLHHEARFSKLQALVDAAARRRAVWLAVGALAAATVTALVLLLG